MAHAPTSMHLLLHRAPARRATCADRRIVRVVIGWLALGLLTSREASAIPLLSGFGGPTGYGLAQRCVHPNDDASYAGPPPTLGNPPAAIPITTAFPSGINFFGGRFSSMFVNTNGNITFRTGFAERTPAAFPFRDQPVIAPWWADVDTRGGGQPMRNNVCFHIEPGRVVVTWNLVGYYASHDNLQNDFQLILTTPEGCVNEGDFDIEFRYNRCEWTTGDASGGRGGLGGTPAQVGFDAANGRNFYQHPMARTMGVLEVCRTTNVPGGEPGLWRFQIRGDGSTGECRRGEPCVAAGQLGVCAQGVTLCDASRAPRCVATIAPRAERCDGYDDDCDGMVDDGDGLCASGYVCDRGACAPSCFGGRACPAGLTCTSAGVCLEGACARVSCQVGQRCESGTCVGACDGVSCPAGQVCRVGRCVSPCLGVDCGPMEVCDRSPGATAGRCVRACQCAGCPAGQQCQPDGRCVAADCVSVQCAPGTYCRGGLCRDACESAPDVRMCPRGEVCRSGECVPDLSPPQRDAGGVDGAIRDADARDVTDASGASDLPEMRDAVPEDATLDARVDADGASHADAAAHVDAGAVVDAPAEPPAQSVGGCRCGVARARESGLTRQCSICLVAAMTLLARRLRSASRTRRRTATP